MAEHILNIEKREKTGKGICRRLRAQALVPGVVYGKGIETTAVSLDPKQLTKAISGEGGMNHLITLQGAGFDGAVVIISDIYRDKLKKTPLHVDLHKINLTEKVRVQVAVNLVGTAVGVKEGGLLDFALHTLEVECLPTAIPEHIDVDVTALTIGHSIHVGEVTAPAGARILDDPKASIISILGRAREEAPAA